MKTRTCAVHPVSRRCDHSRGRDHGQKQKEEAGRNRFVIGRHGSCEALLYEFRERLPSITESANSKSADQPKPHTARITANTLDEALEYLPWDEPLS
jgi:hypothetical protein